MSGGMSMKQTKAMIAILLAMVLLIGCTACGKKKAETTDLETGKTQTEQSSSAPGNAEPGKTPDGKTPDGKQPESSAAPVESVTYKVDGEHGASFEVQMGVEEGKIDEEGEDEPSTTPKPIATAKPYVPSGDITPGSLKWEEFYALSSEAKDAYLHSFDNYDDFFNWMIAAQAQFKIDHPDIEIAPNGSIDLSKLK